MKKSIQKMKTIFKEKNSSPFFKLLLLWYYARRFLKCSHLHNSLFNFASFLEPISKLKIGGSLLEILRPEIWFFKPHTWICHNFSTLSMLVSYSLHAFLKQFLQFQLFFLQNSSTQLRCAPPTQEKISVSDTSPNDCWYTILTVILQYISKENSRILKTFFICSQLVDTWLSEFHAFLIYLFYFNVFSTSYMKSSHTSDFLRIDQMFFTKFPHFF